MFIRFKKNHSGTTSVVVVEKLRGRYKENQTVGIAKDESDLSVLRQKGLEWIHRRELELPKISKNDHGEPSPRINWAQRGCAKKIGTPSL